MMTSKRSIGLALLFAVLLSVIPPRQANAGFLGPNVELLQPTQISERLRNEAVLFNTGGSQLQIKTKSAAVGGFLMGMVLSSAMASGGGGGPTTAAQLDKQMQANMAIAQQANVNLQGAVTSAAASASGQRSSTSAKLGPLPLVAQQLSRAFVEQHVAIAEPATDPVPTLKLSLTQKIWMLDFSMASSDYTLSSSLTLELLDAHVGKIHLRHSCDRDYPRKMPLEAWESNDHQEVANAAEEIAKHCVKQFAVALNIPLPDNNPPAPLDGTDEQFPPAAEMPAPTAEPPKTAVIGSSETTSN